MCHYTLLSFSAPSTVLPWDPSQPTGFPLPVAPFCFLSFVGVYMFVLDGYMSVWVHTCVEVRAGCLWLPVFLIHLLSYSLETGSLDELEVHCFGLVCQQALGICLSLNTIPTPRPHDGDTGRYSHASWAFMWLMQSQTLVLSFADPAYQLNPLLHPYFLLSYWVCSIPWQLPTSLRTTSFPPLNKMIMTPSCQGAKSQTLSACCLLDL